MLKDGSGAGAGLRCAMFRRAAMMLPFNPQDGQQVELRGRLAVYEARGELQMIVEAMQRVGVGTLYEEFLRLKARLAAQGLFDMALKRPLPAFPRRLAVITSPSGAAIHDVLTTLARRAPQVGVVLVPALVQGTQAPDAVVQALARANELADVELILLCRGGGSLEDLWAFNDERVVRAVRIALAGGLRRGARDRRDAGGPGGRPARPRRPRRPSWPHPNARPCCRHCRRGRTSFRAACTSGSMARRKGSTRWPCAPAHARPAPGRRTGPPVRPGAAARRHAGPGAGGARVALTHRCQRLVPGRAQCAGPPGRPARPRRPGWRRSTRGGSCRRLCLGRGRRRPGHRLGTSLQPGQTLRAVWSDGAARTTVDEVFPTPGRRSPLALCRAAALPTMPPLNLTAVRWTQGAAPTSKGISMEHTLPPLFRPGRPRPHMRRETTEYHHGKHHNAYVGNLNNLQKGTEFEAMPLEDIVKKSSGGIYNNAAQIWNHTFFWNCLKKGGGGEPGGALAAAINAKWGSYAAFKEAFTKSAVGNFGSGWTWLVKKADGSVDIVNMGAAGTPLTTGDKALLCVDVWEHAYYIDYRNLRPKYVETFLNHLVNWDFAAKNFA
jgi:superoxide dismutase